MNVVAFPACLAQREAVTQVIPDIPCAVIVKVKLGLVKIIRRDVLEPVKSARQPIQRCLVKRIQQVKPGLVFLDVQLKLFLRKTVGQYLRTVVLQIGQYHVAFAQRHQLP